MSERYGYMCKVAWDWELGEDWHGTKIYPSLEALMEHHSCIDECGIVKVRIDLDSIIQDSVD